MGVLPRCRPPEGGRPNGGAARRRRGGPPGEEGPDRPGSLRDSAWMACQRPEAQGRAAGGMVTTARFFLDTYAMIEIMRGNPGYRKYVGAEFQTLYTNLLELTYFRYPGLPRMISIIA